ncbi:hypothetical protein FNH09_21425 [Streptomyces adustus]|uniref:Uncharacterized protein n=1 Tax=Streptomyces adustus TaxID=1609272 RepID=A0A5N8VEP5_9ACTN|nr:hypothetical protein [Streptomyces adustus]MPY33707.1 hypothetical protein [Streptomyces adustus]
MSVQSSDTVTVINDNNNGNGLHNEMPGRDDPAPSAISLNVALDAAIGIFTGRLGSYFADTKESTAQRAERYAALAWRHPALLPE